MFTTRPELRGTFGMVASTHWLASQAGMAVLERGGNAFDAAVAAGFTLQVVEPHLNGPGGEVPILFALAESDKIEGICGQGVAPAKATIAHYRALGLELVPGSGLLAAVVPGAFDAWMLMLRDHGTMRPREVLEYAIGFARIGYPLVDRICETIASVETLFRKEWPTSAALYLPGDRVPHAGTLFRNPVLADAYERILSEAETTGSGREAQIEAARRIWSQGFIAEEIDRFCRGEAVMDSSGRRHKGVLTAEDMAGWQATYEKPLTYDYKGATIAKFGPWCQGPVFLQQLALLEGYELDRMDPLEADFVHLVTEAAKLAFADREAFYGDPNFVAVPIERLLSPAYNAKRRRLISDRASDELRPGSIPGFGGPVDYESAARAGERPEFDALGGGEPTTHGTLGQTLPGDTCHLDVVDRHGNIVSATPSGGWLHSSPIIPALGLCLGSRAQMFWLREGLPASLEPGKRPRSTLTPSLALRDGGPWLAFGTPGGDYQDQWSLTFFLRLANHHMNLQEAIDCPMFHTDHMPSSFWPRTALPASLSMEARFPEKTIRELKRRGHKVTMTEPWSLGRLSAAGREGALLIAGANPRFMQGYAVGR
ncbi:MAG TPA: gamma-glutamyltransferase family protein [Alphaproteobacteria bacterium]|nr:gamma-glutamyltransferase family protein [Alphaproteobacteria bacterium]